MSDVLKALGNPARLKIIQLLLQKPNSTCGDFLEMMPLAQSTVSKHISELKRVKLIKGKNSGNNIYYSLNEKTWEKVQAFINSEITPQSED
jgi:DNA-binding transcriptional ArsR family regulator